jgi:protein ImuB
MSRRVVAVVLPQLACELVRQRVAISGPLGVMLAPLAEGEGGAAFEPPATAVLDVVDDEARRYGVRPGQKVAEAAALVGRLSVHRVTHAELDAALGRVAEIALGLGTTAALRLTETSSAERSLTGAAPFDTVWLDVTGAAHLVGGEEALLDELAARLAPLGHRVRAALADGPRLAQALARWGTLAGCPAVAPAGQGAHALAPLPVAALPVEAETASFLVRLGVITVGDLARLPRASLAARLGARAAEVLELAAGRDAAPLVPYAPPRVLEEDARFEEGVEGAEALLFVLRAMTTRLGARLAARGEAASRLEVTIPLDRSIARLRGVTERLAFHVELPAPLAEPNDLLRALKAKLERTELPAPAVGLALTIPQIAPARRVQLDLSRGTAVSPDVLPALLAELSAEIGAERVGVLEVVDALAPEQRSRLVPVSPGAKVARGLGLPCPLEITEPTRLLPAAVGVGRITRGGVGAVDRQLYAFERVRFSMRLDGVAWWTLSPTSRDYVSAWLAAGAPGSPGASCGEAWAYVDRATGEGFLQGWVE